jgi:hypothetical protein
MAGALVWLLPNHLRMHPLPFPLIDLKHVHIIKADLRGVAPKVDDGAAENKENGRGGGGEEGVRNCGLWLVFWFENCR